MRKKEIPPRAGFTCELQRIKVSLSFLIPRVEANLRNSPLIRKERIMVLKK